MNAILKHYKAGDSFFSSLREVDDMGNTIAITLNGVRYNEDDIEEYWMDEQYWNGATFVDEGPASMGEWEEWVDEMEYRVRKYGKILTQV
jgi:hypothetical protein